MEKISKSQVKLVKSLQVKKFRDELGLFVAEGEKCVDELRKSFELVHLYINSEAINVEGNKREAINAEGNKREAIIVPKEQLEQMSGLRTPQGVIAVFKKSNSPQDGLTGEAGLTSNSPQDGLILALDGIQDPGNLGTIIRTCDWFGVHDIVCSRDTADCYNPKVVQATMGALARVRVHYVDLPEWIRGVRSQESGVKIFGTLLDGRDMYEVLTAERSDSETVCQQSGLSVKRSIIVMGNEGNGISPAVRSLVTHPIRIPSYPKNAETSESLNVSIATAIVLAEVRRNL